MKILCTLIFFATTSFISSAGDITPNKRLPDTHYEELKSAVGKKRSALKDTYLKLELSAKSFALQPEPKELAKALKFYHEIFKFDPDYFIVEMFAPIYNDLALRPKLMEALVEGLSSEDRQEFLKRLKMVISEKEEGNG